MDKTELTQIQEAKRQPSLSKAMLHTLTRRMSFLLLAVVVLLSVAISVLDSHITESKYSLSPTTQQLAGESYAKLKTELKRDDKTGDLQFKPELQTAQTPAQNKISNKEGQYSITIKNDPKEGVQYFDPDSGQSFSLKPNFDVLAPRVVDDHVVLPAANSATQQVYTFKSNGLKEDLVVTIPQGDSLSFSYNLDLPATLEARKLPSGEIGIYTGTEQGLFGGQISYGSDKDKELVQKAQAKAKKDRLVFVLPAPVIKQAGNKDLLPETTSSFELSGKTLTVKAAGLSRLKYPISIDPSTIVTSSSSLGQGNDQGNTTYDSSTGQISRTPISGGKVSGQTLNTNFPVGISQPAIFAFNGVLYAAGGCTVFTSNFCTTAIATVYHTTLNADGSPATWSNTPTDDLPSALWAGQVTVYNGYVYYTGVLPAGSPPSTSSTVYYSKINSSTGKLNGWTTTTSMNAARAFNAVVAVKGYLYVFGGCATTAAFTSGTAACGSGSSSLPSNGTEYAPIKADGSLGSWTISSTYYDTACEAYLPSGGRCANTSAQVYNGNIYIQSVVYTGSTVTTLYVLSVNEVNGSLNSLSVTSDSSADYFVGFSGGYAVFTSSTRPVNADGSISSQIADSTGLGFGGTYYYRGYFYLVGTTIFATPTVYSANFGPNAAGSMGTGAETTLSIPNNHQRANTCTVAYNSYVYMIGGDEPGPIYTTSVYSAQIAAEGGIGSWTLQTNNFTTGRYLHTCQVYAGFLYVIAGNDGSTATDLSDIQYASVSAGTVGTFSTATAKLPSARVGLSSVIYKNGNGNVYLYALGGCISSVAACSTGSTAMQQIYYGTINTTTGNVCGDNAGSWDCASAAGTRNLRTASANSGNALYAAMHSFSALVYKGKLYILGGMTSATTRVTTVKYIDISSTSSDGDISNFANWQTASSFNVATTGRALFTATIWNGYIYAPGGVGGTTASGTALSTSEYAQINSDGSLGTWTGGTSLSATWQRYGSVAYEGKVYIISGTKSGSRTRSYFQFSINNGGGGGGYGPSTAATSLPNARFIHASAAYNGYLYVAGGMVCADASNPCSSTTATTAGILYAQINDSGVLGSWTSTTNLSTARTYFRLLAYNGNLYALGGCSDYTCGTRYNTTEYAPIASNGTLGTFTATSSFTTGRGGFGAFQYNGYVYIVGGCGGTLSSTTCSSNLADVQYAQIQSNGTLGSWTTNATSLPTTGWAQFATNNAGYAYAGGGLNTSGSPAYDIYYAQINSNGSIGSWTTEYYVLDIPHSAGFGSGNAFVNNGFLYVTNNAGDVMAAPLGNSGGLIGPWNTSSNLITGLAGGGPFGSIAVYNGMVFALGGSFVFSIYSNTYRATVYNSPRIGTYSKAIDTDVDTTPEKVYFSGSNTNNPNHPGTEGRGGISIKYRSTSQTITAVNTSTLINPGLGSLFGTLYDYVAYDGTSGLSGSRARVYSINVKIDESYVSSFPDNNLASGDYFSGYTFWYHPGSGTRLRGGKTFTGESLQSLDAAPN